MPEIWYAASGKSEGNELKTFELIRPMDQVDIDYIKTGFNYIPAIGQVKVSYEMTLYCAQELFSFTSKRNLDDLFAKGVEETDLAFHANRLCLSFCASLSSFLDRINRSIKILSDSKREEFEKHRKELHANNMEYRFFYNLRNYILHFDYPFHVVRASLENGIDIICYRDHLLEYKEWKHARKDILALPDEVVLRDYIEQELVLLTTLWIFFNYCFLDFYIDNDKWLSNYIKKYNLDYPIYFILDKEIKKGEEIDPSTWHPQFFSLKTIVEGINTAGQMPGVTIKHTSNNDAEIRNEN